MGGYPKVANSESKPKRTKLKPHDVRGKGLQQHDHLIYGATQSTTMRQLAVIIKRERELIILAFQSTEKAGSFVVGYLASYEGFGMRRDRQ